MNIKEIIIVLAHGLVGWALCGASMGIGMATTSLDNALIIHAVSAPIIFSIVSLIYFKNFSFTRPLRTAFIFVGVVIAMDFFVVSLLINKNFDMFYSPLGTWIPFALIFISTYLTGNYVVGRTKSPMSA